MKKEAKNKAIKTAKDYQQNPMSLDPNVKKLIEENIQINGEGRYLVDDLECYYYNQLSSSIEELL